MNKFALRTSGSYETPGTFFTDSTYLQMNAIQECPTVADFVAIYGELQFLFGLNTPLSYHFDNIGQLYTYLGTNNVWIDTGAITECTYPADTKLYVDGLTEPDEDMIADDLIASGKYFTVNNQLYLSTAQIAAGAQIIPGSNCTATSITEALNALNA